VDSTHPETVVQDHLDPIQHFILQLLQVAVAVEVLETLMICLAVLVAVLKGSKQKQALLERLVKDMLAALQTGLLVQRVVVVLVDQVMVLVVTVEEVVRLLLEEAEVVELLEMVVMVL
jgi:hypothetical protein